MKLPIVIPMLLVTTFALAQLPEGAIQFRGGEEAWVDGPSTLPPGTKALRLEGDPRAEGIFTLRLKVPAGARLAPHWHPRDERVTVLSGEARLGFGDEVDEVDEKTMASFGPGSFYLNPANSHHYLIFTKETVLQLTGVGPWELHYVGNRQ